MPMNVGAPYAARPAYRQPATRMTRKVGAPLAVMIVLGVAAGLVMVLIGLVSPLLFGVGLVPALLFFGGAVLAYLWLDRWEPEPLRLILFALLWGGSVAIVGSLLVELAFGLVVPSPELQVAVGAPIIEEAFKGALLLVMLTGRRRHEMNTLVDFLFYAGMVGLGFAFVEDLLYISSSESVGGALVTAALRLIMGVFAHPFFTSATAIGLYFATRASNGAIKALLGIGGYLVAVGLHAAWNGSSVFGLGAYLLTYLLLFVPLFAGLIVLAIRSRRVEGRTVVAQLPRMVAEDLVSPREADWLSSLRGRRAGFAAVKTAAGPSAVKQARHFADVVTELAFLRERIAAGMATQETFQAEAELVESVRTERGLALPGLMKTWQTLPGQTSAPGYPVPPGANTAGQPGYVQGPPAYPVNVAPPTTAAGASPHVGYGIAPQAAPSWGSSYGVMPGTPRRATPAVPPVVEHSPSSTPTPPRPMANLPTNRDIGPQRAVEVPPTPEIEAVGPRRASPPEPEAVTWPPSPDERDSQTTP